MTNTEPTPGTPLRPTRQRVAVTEALSRSREFRSAQEIHEIVAASGEKVGLATVYRTLAALAESGSIDVLRREDGESVYRQCAAVTHHHHLVCRECGATVEIAGPAVEAWTDAIASEHGYADISHSLELFGTCPSCS
jgi:Fur family ferric uptake transcriptional regulator